MHSLRIVAKKEKWGEKGSHPPHWRQRGDWWGHGQNYDGDGLRCRSGHEDCVSPRRCTLISPKCYVVGVGGNRVHDTPHLSGNILARTIYMLFSFEVALHIAVDWKDFFTYLSSQRNSKDEFIRSHVNLIRYEFDRHNMAQFIWLPCILHISDPGTNTDSPLIEALPLPYLNFYYHSTISLRSPAIPVDPLVMSSHKERGI